MSFVKNFFRGKVWNAYGKTEFGECKAKNGKFHSAERMHYDGWRTSFESYEDEKNTHCCQAINNLLYKLAQAELQGDFVDDSCLGDTIETFLEKRDEIYDALTQFEGRAQKEINEWFTDKANQQLLSDFLICLNNIYEYRTTFAKFKDFCWELADAIVIAVIAVGVAAIVIKLAGIGIFGAAFSSLVKSVPFVTELEGVGTLVIGAMGLQNGWYKFFKSAEEKPIKKAIEQDLQQNANTNRREGMLPGTLLMKRYSYNTGY